MKTGCLLEHPQDSEWWYAMKMRNDTGIVTARVRLVTEPLSDYTKMELAYLKEAKEYSGDDIRIITESALSKITSEEILDYWMIDNTSVFLMKYGEMGKYLHSEQTHDVEKYRQLKKELTEKSGSL